MRGKVKTWYLKIQLEIMLNMPKSGFGKKENLLKISKFLFDQKR